MTTPQHPEIHKLLLDRSFNEAKLLFEKSNLTGSDLISIYKKRNRKKEKPFLFDQSEFWQSELPLLCLDELMKSEIKSDFLHKYFSKNENVSDQLNIELFSNFTEDFKRYFKFNRAFLFLAFRESLKRISSDSPAMSQLSFESQFIYEELKRIDRKQEEINHTISQLGMAEILMGLTLYYQGVKYDRKMAGNKLKQFEIENALLEFVQHALTVNENSAAEFKFTSNEKMQTEFKRYELPHPILGKKGLHIPLDGIYQLISNLSSEYIELLIRKNSIELYQCQYAEFISGTLKAPVLEVNQEYTRFRKNDYKKGIEEFYFLETTLDNLMDRNPHNRISTTSDVKMFEFYGIPKHLELSPHRVDLEKALSLLKQFSTYKGPPERTISPSKTVVHNEADESFKKLFGTNESITLFEYNQLKEGIANYFNWPEMEIDFLLDFLSYDLNKDDPPHLWIQRPFLKINDQVIWPGAFLKDRRWNNILLNRIRKEYSGTIGKEIAANLEKRVEAIFQEAGFTTTQGLKYPPKGESRGDIDVVAFRDNYLFICEAKSGERNHDFSYAAQREMVKLGETAVHQLNKALRSKDLYWKELQKRLGFEVDMETVHIVPMIITDTFEGDDYFNETGIRKISLLELDVILKNQKRELLEMFQVYEMIANRRRFQSKEDSDWDLWRGMQTLKCEQFLEIIDENQVWGDSL